jgi:hypothetical protein
MLIPVADLKGCDRALMPVLNFAQDSLQTAQSAKNRNRQNNDQLRPKPTIRLSKGGPLSNQ